MRHWLKVYQTYPFAKAAYEETNRLIPFSALPRATRMKWVERFLPKE